MLRQLSSNQVEALRDVPFKETRFGSRTGCLAILFVAETPSRQRTAWDKVIFRKNLVHSESEEFAINYNKAFEVLWNTHSHKLPRIKLRNRSRAPLPDENVQELANPRRICNCNPDMVASAKIVVPENTLEVEYAASDVAPILPHGGRRPTKGGSCFETTSVFIEEMCFF